MSIVPQDPDSKPDLRHIPETQQWPQAVAAMQRYAVETNDAVLYLVAGQVQQVVDTHWDATIVGAGCGSCHGEVSLCGTWDNAQAIVLTFLMQKAGLV